MSAFIASLVTRIVRSSVVPLLRPCFVRSAATSSGSGTRDLAHSAADPNFGIKGGRSSTGYPRRPRRRS
jgi:hypothetical protein